MLRNRNFLFLWLVTVTTTVGIELFTISILVTIFEQTDSTLLAAGTMVARMLPSFLLGPIAGVLVDRFPRKLILICMDVGRLLLVGVAILTLQGDGDISVIGVYLILFALATADVFHRPARLSLIPALVPVNDLVRANSFILVWSQIILASSYALGSWLIISVSLSQIAISIIILFGFAIVFAMSIQVTNREKVKSVSKPEPFFTSLISGWQYLRRHPIARPLTIMETIEHLPHGIWTGAIMLAFTIDGLGATTTEWGYQISGYFVGMIVGSLVAMGLTTALQKYPGKIIVVNAFGAGFLTITYAISPTVAFAVIVAFIFGPPFAIRDVAQDSLLQATVDEKQLGRVYATRQMLSSMVFMFAGLFFAWLSDFMPIQTIYLIGGAIYLLTAIYALSNKALRQSKLTPELLAKR